MQRGLSDLTKFRRREIGHIKLVVVHSKSTGLVVGETGELDSEATSHVAESKAVSAYSDFTEYVVGCAATGGFWTDHNLMLTPTIFRNFF